MKVFHIVRKELEEISPQSEETYEFFDGDTYVIDNGNEIYIWLGKDSGVDEKTVGAWVANQMDNEERGGEPTVFSVTQGDEPDELKNLLNFTVKDADTPGFLKQAELDLVNYSLYQIAIKEDTIGFDDAEVSEVEMEKSSLTSDDVFVLDGNESVFMFVGKNAQREERFEGQKLMQKIDADRDYLPLTYTIYEGEGTKSEKAFYQLLEKAKDAGPVVSVEDKRELSYRPEEAKTAEEHKREVEEMEKKEKKGFFSRIFSWLS